MSLNPELFNMKTDTSIRKNSYLRREARMLRAFILLFAMLVSSIHPQVVVGQCTAGRSCLYISSPNSPSTVWQGLAGSLFNGTTYNRYDFYLISGNTYIFSLCPDDGGTANYDTYLCLYGYGSGCGLTTALASNDDYCGVQSRLEFVAFATGMVSLYVSGYGSAYGSYTLSYKLIPGCSGSGAASTLKFDAANDYVVLGNGGTSVTGTFTVECWAKPSSSGTLCVMGSRAGSSANNTFDFKFSNQNTIHGDIGDGTNWITTSADASFSYTTGTWYHVAYVVTPSGYTIYVNGNPVGSGSFSGTPVLFNSTNLLTLGAYSSSGGEYFDGNIDEVRIWNTARTQAQIQASMNCEMSAPACGLVASYHFNQGTICASNAGLTTLTADVGGSTYNGTLYNFALSGGNSNWTGPGGVTSGSACPSEMIVPASGSNSYTVCSGHLYDNGGSACAYGAGSSGYTVIYPDVAGNKIQLTGNYYTEYNWDFVYIYNGVGDGAPLLYSGSASGITPIGPFTSTDATGALTVKFTSDGSVQNSGFDFTIACVVPCVGTLSIAGPALACAYTDISYTASPSGFGGTPTYQWYYSNADGSSTVAFGASSGTGVAPYYTTYSGGTSQILNINTYGGNYDHMHVWCVATYGVCSATSNNIALVTESAITAPSAGTHTPSQTQIVWNWNSVSGATGYKWNTTNNYATATDMGTGLSKTETGLTCGTAYTRYVWAYKACGYSSPTTLSATTAACCTTPVVSNMSASICSGASFSVTPVNGTNGTVPAGTTYSWSAPSVAGIAGTASGSNAANISGTLTNSTSGNVNVVYTVTPKSGSCTGATFNVTVTVIPLPSASISPNPVPQFCYGSSQTLTATTACGSPTWQWFRNGSNTGVTTSTYSATIPGIYTAKVTCSGCSATSNAVTVTVQSNDFTLNVNQPATTGLSTGCYVWSGNTSIDWAVPSNWLVYNGGGVFYVATVIPDSTKEVFIRAYSGCASNLCNILNSYTAHCKSITIESSLTMGTASLLNVARNWNNVLGTLNPGTGTVGFNGKKLVTGTIYPGGTGAGKQFYNLEVKSESNTTAGSNDGNKVNLEGNIRINNNFILTSGYQFNVNSGSTMSIGGNFTHNICEFNRGLGSVTLTGASKVIDGAAATYFRILNISGSYTLTEPEIYLWSNPLGDYGDLNILAGGSLNATDKTIHIDGNWSNNGTFTAGTSTVSFERAYDQTIFSGGSSFYNFRMNKTAAPPYVAITDPAWISGYGDFQYGVVNYSGTGSLTFTDNATSNGGATNSFVDGPVIKTGNENFLYPVGDVTAVVPWQPHVWAPLAINNTSGTATDKFSCQYFFTAAPNNFGVTNMCDFATLHHVSGIEYWDLTRTNGSSIPNVTLYYKNASRSGIQNPTGLVVAHWENCPATMTNKWVSKGGAVVEDIAGVAGHVTNTIAFPSFSPVTFGTTINNNPLPVSLIDFVANCSNGEVIVEWSTASETNNELFTVERSADAQQWQEGGSVPGAGNHNSLLHYALTDHEPLPGVSYYRLKQTDWDGQTETFDPVISVCGEPALQSISYYPNPFTSELIADIRNLEADQAEIFIFDMLGKKVFGKTFSKAEMAAPSISLDLSSLSAGVYSIEFRSESFTESRKIIKNF